MGVADYRSYLYILDTLQIEKLQILKLVVYLDSVFYGKLDSNNTYINFASCFNIICTYQLYIVFPQFRNLTWNFFSTDVAKLTYLQMFCWVMFVFIWLTVSYVKPQKNVLG
jgi:hypothetical protein